MFPSSCQTGLTFSVRSAAEADDDVICFFDIKEEEKIDSMTA